MNNDHSSLEISTPTGYPAEIQAVAKEITELWTDPEERNKGWATKLMKQAIEEADAAGFHLLVHVKPEDGQTDIDRLQSFYAKLGFEPFQQSPLLMVRKCQKIF